MSKGKAKVSGRAQGAKTDLAEKWLSENDPKYVQNKRRWQTPTTDALARSQSECNAPHHTLEDLVSMEPRGNGNYYRRRANAERPFEYSDIASTEPDS